jgi:hypothetical protein
MGLRDGRKHLEPHYGISASRSRPAEPVTIPPIQMTHLEGTSHSPPGCLYLPLCPTSPNGR